MEDIATLLDLLEADDTDWADASDELLAAGYTWTYSGANDCYRLLDLSNSNYFG